MKLEQLIDHLSQTDFFPSIYNIRVLSYLIHNQKPATAKEVSQFLDIPDSKVYPAINWLVSKHLVTKLANERPNRYFFSDPYQLEKFLDSSLEHLRSEKKELVSDILQAATAMWDPEEEELGNIAYLFRGEDISRQIYRIITNSKSSLKVFLSANSVTYLQVLVSALLSVLEQDIEVELSLPYETDFTSHLGSILGNHPPNLSLKKSVWQGNSYIIRDGSHMLNIIHQIREDVALLTNDDLLVSNISRCWTDTNCCVGFNDDELVQLELSPTTSAS